MREFTKNVLSFSWAMSLFGANQMGSVLSVDEVGEGLPGSTAELKGATEGLVEQFGKNLRDTFDVGDRLQREMVDAVFNLFAAQDGGTEGGEADARNRETGVPAILDARSQAGEEVMISYTRGEGRFSVDKRFIALRNQIYNLDGEENGVHQGVWEAMFTRPEDLLARPGVPVGPMDAAVGPVDEYPISANTIAKWTHKDGSSISSVGPAASHLVPLSDGSFLFLVITAQIITEGTGRFARARGLTQSLGATFVPAGTNLFSEHGPETFPATTLDTFKFVQGGERGEVQRGGRSRASRGHGENNAGRAGADCWPMDGAGDSKLIEVLGSRMHCIDSGAGDAVVFLHGNPTWSYLWRNVVPEVSKNFRCIAPDLIGMGMSDKPDIEYSFFDHVKYFEGFIEAMGLEEYTLVLHDWGCLIGFYHAMRHEDRVRGMAFMEAMLGPYTKWSDFPDALVPTFRAFRDPKTGRELVIEQNAFIEEALPASTLAPLGEDIMECYRKPFLDPADRRVILKFAQQIPVAGRPADVAKAAGEYSRWLKKTEIPKLFLWAKPGLISTEDDVEWAKKNYKNLSTSYVGEGLHFLQESHPVTIGREVGRWVEGSVG